MRLKLSPQPLLELLRPGPADDVVEFAFGRKFKHQTVVEVGLGFGDGLHVDDLRPVIGCRIRNSGKKTLEFS